MATVNATGTVVPEEVIDVGAQVVGRIVEFGPDPDPSEVYDHLTAQELKPGLIFDGDRVPLINPPVDTG